MRPAASQPAAAPVPVAAPVVAAVASAAPAVAAPAPDPLADVDPAYFSESFSMRAFEQALPATLDDAWLVADIARLEAQLAAVQTQLTTNVRRAYPGFVQAIREVNALEGSTRRTVADAHDARAHLRAVQRDAVQPGLRILAGTRRRARLTAVLALTATLATLQSALAAADALAAQQNYGAALSALQDVIAAGKRDAGGAGSGDARWAAARALVERAKQQRDAVAADLRAGRGFPDRLVCVANVDGVALAEWLRALELAGDEWATPSQRLSLLHRCLLRNVDRQLGALLGVRDTAATSATASTVTTVSINNNNNNNNSSGSVGGDVKAAALKDAWQTRPAARLVDDVVRALQIVAVALRIQHLLGHCLGPTHAPAMASLRGRMWTELARRVSMALASKAVYGCDVGAAAAFYWAAHTALLMGRDYGDDAAQYAKLHAGLVAVMQRWHRHAHKAALLELHAALSAEHWTWGPPEGVSLVAPPPQTPQYSYDAAAHHPLRAHWSDPFAEGIARGATASASAQSAAADDDGDDEPLTVGDEMGDAAGAAQHADTAASAAAAESRLWAALRATLGDAERLTDACAPLVPAVASATLQLLAYLSLAVWGALGGGGGPLAQSAAVASFLADARRRTVTPRPGDGDGLLDLFSAPVADAPAQVTLTKSTHNTNNNNNGNNTNTANNGGGDDVQYTLPLPAVSAALRDALAAPATGYGLVPRLHGAATLAALARCATRLRAVWAAGAGADQRRLAARFDTTAAVMMELRAMLLERAALALSAPGEVERAVLASPLWCDSPPPAAGALAGWAADLVRRARALHALLARTATPRDAQTSLWSYFIAQAMGALLAGFAGVRRCDDAGRSAMLMHVTQLAAELGKLTALRPLPLLDRVRAYVQAYFEKEAVVDNWIAQFHYQYDEAQLVNLLNVAHPKMARKDRAAALQRIKQWKSVE